MQKTKKAETLASLIVAMVILSFVLLGIFQIFEYNQYMMYDQHKQIKHHLLEKNSHNIMRKLDISNIPENEIFFLKKDIENKNYTLTQDENYKQINSFWEAKTDGVFFRTFTKNSSHSQENMGELSILQNEYTLQIK